MPISVIKALGIVLVAAACTFFTRVLPFALFGGRRKMPRSVEYLGKILPPAIMATLVVYCLKSVELTRFPASGLAELLAIGVVVVLHLWRRNTLLSIAGGTVCYMLLI